MAERWTALRALIAADASRMRILALVRALELPDCWVAAGFVRSLVWDHLHGHVRSSLPPDIDVIWYSPLLATSEQDAWLTQALCISDKTLDWSVKNQARMHRRNADQPYLSATDAMRYWPETATAVAVRLSKDDLIEIAAPFGLDDLFDLRVRPTARFLDEKHCFYLARLHAKKWQLTWPGLTIQNAP